MTDKQPKRVVLLCADLMMTSSAGHAARAAGVQLTTTSRPDEALAAVSQDPTVRLLIDFGLPGLDIADFANQLPAATREATVAYGPHVHIEKIQAARSAGLGHVTSRGDFTARLQDYLTS
jgi:CheY-like chemotaxis protein